MPPISFDNYSILLLFYLKAIFLLYIIGQTSGHKKGSKIKEKERHAPFYFLAFSFCHKDLSWI
jgi:hypothetical protein